MPSISIVIPAFNEEAAIIKGNLRQVSNWLYNNFQKSELLVVNDGSNDQTEELASYVADRVINIPHSGKAFAIMTGIKNAVGEVILFIDMDLDTPISEAAKLLGAISRGADIAIGSRSRCRPGTPMQRRILSKGHTILRRLLLDLDMSDTQCGFKAFKREAALRILNEMQVYRVDSIRPGTGHCVNSGYDLEILLVARNLGYRLDEISVKWKYSQGGKICFLKETFHGFLDILKIATIYKKL